MLTEAKPSSYIIYLSLSFSGLSICIQSPISETLCLLGLAKVPLSFIGLETGMAGAATSNGNSMLKTSSIGTNGMLGIQKKEESRLVMILR